MPIRWPLWAIDLVNNASAVSTPAAVVEAASIMKLIRRVQGDNEHMQGCDVLMYHAGQLGGGKCEMQVAFLSSLAWGSNEPDNPKNAVLVIHRSMHLHIDRGKG